MKFAGKKGRSTKGFALPVSMGTGMLLVLFKGFGIILLRQEKGTQEEREVYFVITVRQKETSLKQIIFRFWIDFT